MRRAPKQFDLFEPKPTGGGEEPSPPPLSDEEALMPVANEEPYEPTPEDEQARLEMEHGPGVRYIPPKTRAEREAEKRHRKRMTDDALGRMGEPGKQLLDPTESPFAQGGRPAPRSSESEVGEEDEKRKREKGK